MPTSNPKLENVGVGRYIIMKYTLVTSTVDNLDKK